MKNFTSVVAVVAVDKDDFSKGTIYSSVVTEDDYQTQIAIDFFRLMYGRELLWIKKENQTLVMTQTGMAFLNFRGIVNSAYSRKVENLNQRCWKKGGSQYRNSLTSQGSQESEDKTRSFVKSRMTRRMSSKNWLDSLVKFLLG